MKFDLLHPADQIVMIMKRIYEGGMTTTSGGNLSIRDGNGDVWITPGGIDKGCLSRSDIMCVKPDGTAVGPHKPSSELPFHLKIYETRPDAEAVLHAHPPGLVAFSIVTNIPDTSIIPNAHQVCGKIGFAPYDVPGSAALGKKIAKKFAEKCDIVMMENHGLVTLGADLFQAFMRFETLEYCARLQINALRLGSMVSLTPEQLALAWKKKNAPLEEFIPHMHTSRERDARREMCEFIHRAYDQHLFTSTQGTFSCRLDDDVFLITPYGVDRKYMEPSDLLLIQKGLGEAGKIPSRSVLVHRDIYKKHPGTNAVIIAHPPHIMAYGLSRTPFDSRTIPESYIMLRDIAVLPYGTNITRPDLISDTVSPAVPLIMVENDFLIVTGDSLLRVYDCLEVAEFSAKALLSATVLGEVSPITEEEVGDLKQAFDLP